MQSLRTACVVLLALAGSSAAAGFKHAAPVSSLQTRRLLDKDAAKTAKQCMWDSKTNSCDAADAVNIMYAARSRPVSPYLWFLLMTHDHKTACDSYQSRDSCRGDAAHNCVWLDDVLADSSSNSKRAGGKARRAGGSKSSAELSSTAAVPNLFTLRMTAMQNEYGSSLREMLARAEVPILNPAMELMAGAAKPGAAAPAPPSTSSGTSSSSSSKQRSSSGSQQLKCTSRELIENLVFTKSGYSSVLQAPLAMHCPGSHAFNLVKCMSAADNGCVVVPRVGSRNNADLCVSQHFNKLSKQEMDKFMYALTLGEPSVVGNCDGACWMRQALLCNHTKGADNCAALSFCRSMGDACVPKLYAQDDFGSTVQEYLGECMETDNRQDCEAHNIKLVSQGKYSQWRMPPRAVAKCLVPSVRGILGRSTQVAKEGAARTEMLTMMEAETEKLAAALAAATAAADAARAGQIMLERGATGLQQLYSTASSILGR